jgi:hypothetical protein
LTIEAFLGEEHMLRPTAAATAIITLLDSGVTGIKSSLALFEVGTYCKLPARF